MSPIRPFALSPLFLCPLIFFSSCATILNGPAQKIRVSADKNITDVSVERAFTPDSTSFDIDRIVTYIVPRSPKPLVIHFRADSVEKTLSIRPHSSVAFWLNIWFNYGIGMLVDWNNPQRYSYPAWNYLSANDSTINHHRYPPIDKHTLRISLAFAPVNIISVASPDGQFNTGGVIGLELGFDYFYKSNRYMSMAVGVGTDAAPVDHFAKEYFRTASVWYANLRNNYVLGSLDLGYGVNVSDFQWTRTTIGDTVYMNMETNRIAFGLSLSAQYRIGNAFRIGVLFQPDFINAAHLPAFKYQHYFAAQLCWKFPSRNSH